MSRCEHIIDCIECGKTICSYCIEDCSGCGIESCKECYKKHQVSCPQCNEILCKTELINNICPVCDMKNGL